MADFLKYRLGFGTDPLVWDDWQSDFNGDGFSLLDEYMLSYTDPNDPDTRNIGVPDGQTPQQWLAHPLWADTTTNILITLKTAIPTNAKAVLIIPD